MIQAPPYALASHAGRAALGGDREIALAAFAVGRLAAAMLPPFTLTPADAAARVANTKQWLSSMALPGPQRAACIAVADAVTAGVKRPVVHAISGLVEAAVRNLDQGSIAELHELMAELG
jgi:hypothetical protein